MRIVIPSDLPLDSGVSPACARRIAPPRANPRVRSFCSLDAPIPSATFRGQSDPDRHSARLRRALGWAGAAAQPTFDRHQRRYAPQQLLAGVGKIPNEPPAPSKVEPRRVIGATAHFPVVVPGLIGRQIDFFDRPRGNFTLYEFLEQNAARRAARVRIVVAKLPDDQRLGHAYGKIGG